MPLTASLARMAIRGSLRREGNFYDGTRCGALLGSAGGWRTIDPKYQPQIVQAISEGARSRIVVTHAESVRYGGCETNGAGCSRDIHTHRAAIAVPILDQIAEHTAKRRVENGARCVRR